MNRRTGSDRAKRWNADLLESNFRIDEQSFTDIMGYLSSFLKNINYFDLNNRKAGTWEQLIAHDPILFKAAIINEPTTMFDTHKEEVLINDENSVKTAEIASQLLSWSDKIQGWADTLHTMGEEKLSYKFDNALRNILEPQTRELKAYVNTLEKEKIQEGGYEVRSFPKEIFSKPIRDISDLEKVLHIFYKVITHLQMSTKEHLEKSFLDRNDHQPHHAIYITFGKLFKLVQEKLNTLSDRHLKFYYENILQQSRRRAKPSMATVCFELLPTVSTAHLAKGTRLSAGKLFGSKEDIEFEILNPLTAHRVELMELETLFFNSSPYIRVGTKQNLVSEVSKNKLISAGKDINPLRDDWYVFGANKASIQNTQIDPNKVGIIGFVIGSPVLYLSEGDREVCLGVHMDEKSSKDIFWNYLKEISKARSVSLQTAFGIVFDDNLRISFSNKKGWIQIDTYTVLLNEAENYFTIQINIDNSLAEIEKLGASEIIPQWPSFKIELNEYAPVYLYSFLNGVAIHAIDIDVQVKRMKHLSAYNNLGKVSLDKAFDLFGPMAPGGSYLMLGKPELFKKDISQIKIEIEWDHIPQDFGGFESYYYGYSVPVDNDTFRVEFSALSGNTWIPSKDVKNQEQHLFETYPCLTPEGYESVQLSKNSELIFDRFDDLDIQKDFTLKEPMEYNHITPNGFIKFTLANPPSGFGSEIYLKDREEIAIFNSKNKKDLPFPNKPYIPKVREISLSYRASDKLYCNVEDSKKNTGELLHIRPFWTSEAISGRHVWHNTLFPQYDHQAYLVMGLKGVKDEINLRIFFHFLRSGSTCDISGTEPVWEYAHNNSWLEFEKDKILHDGTMGLTKTGILELVLPKTDNTNDGDLFWLRAKTKTDAEHYPRIKGIYFNPVQAVCTSEEEVVLGKNLEPGRIKSLVGKHPNIKKVLQPGTSYGGQPEEMHEEFYGRVSERLRHKDRAVSPWDFERLLLDKFDTVQIAKCTNLDQLFTPVPGKLHMIVLNKLWTHDERYYFKNSTLNYMKEYLKRRSSAMVEIEVMNPIVEYLLVKCEVEFKGRENLGYLTQQLNNAICEFLSPLNTNESEMGGIGGSVVPSTVSSYVSDLPYVLKVNRLCIEHIIRKRANSFVLDVYEEGNAIHTTTPWSILSPMKEHRIEYTNEHEVNKVVIGNMEIGTDFILQESARSISQETEAGINVELEPNAAFVFQNK